MLILQRKVDEEIVLGENANIVVKVVEIHNSYVRLGITAPREWPVWRREVFDLIQLEAVKKAMDDTP